mmetsp:Transcript_20385/g.54318  ORF Transcript_20385/g.54318 Transcript_20385/m.54318 type:complete len:201 (+) Transcript_20385:316-918(+)
MMPPPACSPSPPSSSSWSSWCALASLDLGAYSGASALRWWLIALMLRMFVAMRRFTLRCLRSQCRRWVGGIHWMHRDSVSGGIFDDVIAFQYLASTALSWPATSSSSGAHAATAASCLTNDVSSRSPNSASPFASLIATSCGLMVSMRASMLLRLYTFMPSRRCTSLSRTFSCTARTSRMNGRSTASLTSWTLWRNSRKW